MKYAWVVDYIPLDHTDFSDEKTQHEFEGKFVHFVTTRLQNALDLIKKEVGVDCRVASHTLTLISNTAVITVLIEQPIP